MANIQLEAESWRVSCGGRTVLTHSRARPFATAILREKEYKANRGRFRARETELDRVPLTELRREGDKLIFSAGKRRLLVRVAQRDRGFELSLEGEPGWAYEFSLPAIEGEAVFGGGEQYRQIDLRGERVVNLVSEHIKAGTVLEKALLPRALYREKEHSQIGSYAPMPVFVTSEKRLIFFKTQADGFADFGAEEYRFGFDACPEKLLLLRAERFEDLARLLAREIPNRQYLPDWCLDGMILGVQGGTETVLEKAFAMQDAGAKICGVWCQDWSGENRTVMGKQVWWNWEADEKLYPGLKEAIQKLNGRGIRFLAYINPYLVKGSRLYEECREKGYLILHKDGSVYHIKSTTFDAGMLDLTNPAAARYTKDVLIKRNMLDLGVSGWMADFGEYLPTDCVLHQGDPKRLHNLWPVLWAKLNREAIEEYGREDVMFFTRSGYTGIQSYAPIMWNGDQHTDLTKDYGMPCVMPASFSLGFSGVSLVHSDIGGFFSFGKLKRDDELFIRWMEMGAFSPLMRSHESIRPWANSQFDAEGVRPYTKVLTAVHAALKPYLSACLEEAKYGVPVLRPDFWPSSDYLDHWDPYAYFLGKDLFVCPVIERRARSRKVFLPEGLWVHLWTGERFIGGRARRVKAPLGRIPVFYRDDSEFSRLFESLKRMWGD